MYKKFLSENDLGFKTFNGNGALPLLSKFLNQGHLLIINASLLWIYVVFDFLCGDHNKKNYHRCNANIDQKNRYRMMSVVYTNKPAQTQ